MHTNFQSPKSATLSYQNLIKIHKDEGIKKYKKIRNLGMVI